MRARRDGRGVDLAPLEEGTEHIRLVGREPKEHFVAKELQQRTCAPQLAPQLLGGRAGHASLGELREEERGGGRTIGGGREVGSVWVGSRRFMCVCVCVCVWVGGVQTVRVCMCEIVGSC